MLPTCKNLDITLDQIETVLNQKGEKRGFEYLFQCPVCKDKHKDNLSFNPKKGLLKCFSCRNNEGGQYVLDLINKKYPNKTFSKPLPKLKPPEPDVWEVNQEQYAEYMVNCNNFLLSRNDLLEFLYNKRRMIKQTVDDCFIGFDVKTNNFVIPIISLKYGMITDFEFRKYSPSKKIIKRYGGGCSTIAMIGGATNKHDTLYITEGLIDGIMLLQFLKEKNCKDFLIYSCSNGVTSLLNCMTEIQFNKFKTIKLILDNDKAGNETTEEIIKKYPFIKDSRKFLKDGNNKDFTEWYIERSNIINE